MKRVLLLVFLVALFSCKKKGAADFEIDGTLYDLSLSQGAANSTIDVYKASINGNEAEYFTSVQTDGAGKFNLTIKRDQFKFLEFRSSKTGYFDKSQRINFSELSVEDPNIVKIDIVGKAWAKIRLIQSNDETAVFKYYVTQGNTSCSECCTAGEKTITGIVDTTIYCINNANSLYELTYYKVATSFTGTKSAITPIGDTAEIVISY